CILLYTIFQSFIDISLGEKPQLEKYIESYHEWILKQEDKDKTQNISSEINKINLSEDEIERITTNRIKVMPGIRWQVFKRDNWRCVACGQSADDNVILHIDHILPRSKGGKDEINNYQTLCETCNIGKSNKDNTNLRNKNAYS
ncbi:MAG TPA: HNH endonuclease, partial [Bacteroidales bacterium]|nr:HNH endonuclease [Bacteroidales bacterium]